jgi:sec-independent protein translocase protein TatA
MFFGLQPWHIAVIIIVALIIFGPRRLPEVGRWLGRSITEFRKGSQEMTSALRDGMSEARDREEQANTIAKPVPTQSMPANSNSAAPNPSANKFCTKCGSANPQEALFCNKCGNPF